MRSAVEWVGATHLLHLAGLQTPTCRANPILGAKVNVLGTLAVFEAVKAVGSQIGRLVYASSAAVFGPPQDYPPGSLHDMVPVAIQMPQRATLEVVETEPVTKGQTASSSYKPAILSNGVRTAVPPHIGTGTRIVIMTEDGSYVERAKD